MKLLYPNCIPVMGAKNIAFYDLEKQVFRQFSKTDFFDEEALETITEFDLKKIHGSGWRLLQDHQFLMTDEDIPSSVEIQPSSYYKWISPSLITNAIIEVSRENGLLKIKDFERLMSHLESILCKHILLKIPPYTSSDHIKSLMHAIDQSVIHSVQLMLTFDKEYDTDDFGIFIMEHSKIKWVIFECSPFKKNLENKIFFYENQLKPSGKKNLDQFVINLFLFSESQLHHSYFNKKLFIGSKGEIKNAPECLEIHGWIQEMDHQQKFIELIKAPSFQKIWYVTKERSEICRSCEFRFMCIDNRVPYLGENGYWYHLQECNYDPYKGKWKEDAD